MMSWPLAGNREPPKTLAPARRSSVPTAAPPGPRLPRVLAAVAAAVILGLPATATAAGHAAAAAARPAAGTEAGPVAAPTAGPVTSAAEETLEFGPFGKVTLYRTSPHPSQVALFVSGDGGWRLGVVDMARSLAALDVLVVGIDVRHYLAAAPAAPPAACTYAAADFEALSQVVEKRLDFPRYQTPVLVGYSSGATLVYAVLVEAPPGTFAGAVSMGFCPDLQLIKPLCKGSGLAWGPGPHGKGVSFLPAPRLPAPWIALQGAIDQVCDPATTVEFAKQVGGGEAVLLPKVGHGFSVPAHWLRELEKAFATITAAAPGAAAPAAGVAPGASAAPAAGAAVAPGGDESAAPVAESVADLPLVEVPAAAGIATAGDPGDALAVILSGDGGWTSLDREVGEALAADGIPVVGWSSLQYYWHARTPEGAAADLARLLRHYLAAWHKERAFLIGYSLGADVLPFLVNRLPADLAARVSLVALIGASHTATFEFHVAEWLGGGGKDLPRTLPEAEKIRAPRVLCFYGAEEADTICPELEGPGVRVVSLAGGHHFGGDFQGIARRILAELRPAKAPG
jgi:type IV secretory pathway VirJ component